VSEPFKLKSGADQEDRRLSMKSRLQKTALHIIILVTALHGSNRLLQYDETMTRLDFKPAH
jgi:hypothetical protein